MKNKKWYSREFRIKTIELSNQRGSLTCVAQELDINCDILNGGSSENVDRPKNFNPTRFFQPLLK